MEGKVLPAAAVAAELSKNFVEVRLHADLGPKAEANHALQQELTGTITLPTFVILDPTKIQVGGALPKPMATHEGLAFAEDFLAFLRSAH